jgi:hypothetical protein
MDCGYMGPGEENIGLQLRWFSRYYIINGA